MGKSKRKKKRHNKNKTYQNNLMVNSQPDKKNFVFNRLKNFWVKSSITFIISIVSMIFTLITIVQWFFPNTSDSIATKNYEKGLIFLEENEFQEAEKYFEKAYNINNNLLDLKYYYSYTEYILRNYDLSYKILKENKNSLNQDEMALYAMYEINNGNIESGKKYIDKISNPEKLKHFSFILYIFASTQVAFLNDYGDGVTTFWLNTILLDKKIDECHILPYIEDEVYLVTGISVDHNIIDETIIRIEQDQKSNLIELNRCKLLMFFLFDLYSIQYDMLSMPVYYLSEGAECFDYLYYKNLSMRYLLFIKLLTIKTFPTDSKLHEKLVAGYETILKKYDYLLSLEQEKSIEIIEENDRDTFDDFKKILNDYENGCLDVNNYNFIIEDKDGNEEITNNFLEIWCEDNLSNIGHYMENFR